MFDNDLKPFLPWEQKLYVKYLGLLIDSYPIGHITSKISKTIGIITRLRYYVPTTVLLTIYRSMIFPYLSYGIAVWGQAAQTYINQILLLRRRALRLIYFASFGAFSLTWLAAILVKWNKRKYLHNNRVQFPEGQPGSSTWLPFLCFGTQTWPPWRHVKTL